MGKVIQTFPTLDSLKEMENVEHNIYFDGKKYWMYENKKLQQVVPIKKLGTWIVLDDWIII